MARRECIDKVAAILYREEAVMVLKGHDGTLSLPSVTASVPAKAVEAFTPLTELIPLIERELPAQLYHDEDRDYLYHPFVSEIPPKFAPTGNRVLLDYFEFEKAKLDPASRLVLERYFYFLPVYKGHLRTIPLEQPEMVKANAMLDCLAGNKKKLPKSEYALFESLILAPSSPTRLRKAFRFLVELYDLDTSKGVAR